MDELNELKEEFVEFGEILKMMGDALNEYFTTTPWQQQLAALVMFVSFVLSLIIRIKFNYRTRGERRVEKAKSLGHVVNGTVISAHFSTDEKGNRKYSGRVGYEVDGRKYSTIFVPSGTSSIIRKGDTEPVYWIDNPKRGFVSCNSMGFLGILEWLLVVSIPVVLGFFTLLVTGGLQK